MKKIILVFVAIGLLTLVGCDKDDDTDIKTTDNQTVNNTQTNSNNSSDDSSTDTDSDDGTTDISSDDDGTDNDLGDETTDSDSDDETIDTTSTTASVEYGEGATDIDGNIYESVIIGDQEWMVQNLRTTEYSDGTPITNVTGDSQWKNLITGAWCYYDNDSKYDTTYGKLYNWYAVETGKLCPTGWYVPTDAEWTVLADYLSSNGSSGTDLKSTSGWEASKNGTDNYGWKAFPGGFRRIYSEFEDIGNFAFWWASNATSMGDGWGVSLEYNDMNKVEEDKVRGHSVRCLKE